MPTRLDHHPSAPGPALAAGDLVRFVEPSGRRRTRVGTVERRIARGRHEGALVVRVGGETRRYVLPPERLEGMGPATPVPDAPASPRPAAAASRRRSPAPRAAGPAEPLRLFD